MPKNYRKAKPIPGTIFDKSLNDDPIAHQRRLGFLYAHGVNPAAIAKNGTVVESLGQGKVRVYYDAIYIPPDEDYWVDGREGKSVGVPPGVLCDHGGAKKRHTVKQIRSFDALLTEVLA